MSLQEAELIGNARVPFELNATDDDEILIVTDARMPEEIWGSFLKAGRSLGLATNVAIMPVIDFNHGEPPLPIQEAIMASDIVLFVCSNPLTHSQTGVKAQRQGIKVLALDRMTYDILSGPASSADYTSIYEEGKRLREKWTEGEHVTITSPLGMDLEASIDGRPGYFAVGKVEKQPEGIDLYAASFPDGEASIAPMEDTADGTIVWDATMDEIGPLNEPITAVVEDGFVTEISGGREAEHLRDYLAKHNHPNSYALAEIAIGINPNAKITGNMREDKRAKGSIHLAVGENTDIGGTLEAPTHLDGVISNSTVKIDEEVIVKDGEVVG